MNDNNDLRAIKTENIQKWCPDECLVELTNGCDWGFKAMENTNSDQTFYWVQIDRALKASILQPLETNFENIHVWIRPYSDDSSIPAKDISVFKIPFPSLQVLSDEDDDDVKMTENVNLQITEISTIKTKNKQHKPHQEQKNEEFPSSTKNIIAELSLAKNKSIFLYITDKIMKNSLLARDFAHSLRISQKNNLFKSVQVCQINLSYFLHIKNRMFL